MSDTQIMMEHIIELNNQVNKLMTKQKKLKKKYKTLKYDIYEDVDEEKQITIIYLDVLFLVLNFYILYIIFLYHSYL